MAIRFYDEALVNKIKNWVTNTQIQITSPSETERIFEIIADKNNDNPIELPMICIRRAKGFKLLSTNKKPLTFDGLTLSANKYIDNENKIISKSLQLNAIPISIEYSIDIYTRKFQEADEYVRNFIFNIVNFPKLTVDIPFNNENIEILANIRISDSIEDNSEIPERIIPGQFTRFTLSLYVDDAYIFDIRVRNNYSLETCVITDDQINIKE